MLSSPYSRPEFDPYSSPDALSGQDAPWPAPTVKIPIRASLQLPGSKSLTNRELVLAALAEGPSVLRRPLHSRDTHLMVEALRNLGTRVDDLVGDGLFGSDWLVTPGELTGSTTIDCGLAGTVMRFLPPVSALALGPTTFDGDASARQRPMDVTISALRALGVDVADEGRGCLPFTVHGSGRVSGGDLTIDASQSSQFVSGLLLSAARFDSGLNLRHRGERLPSIPHIDMTIDVLRRRGVEATEIEPGHWHVSPGPIESRDSLIEPDLSNAAPFLAAALITGGSVTIEGWPTPTTQVGSSLLEILPLFGGTVEQSETSVTVVGSGRIAGVDLDLSTGGELAPSLIALAALADEPSTISGIGHIRHHETDRLYALTTEISKLGGNIVERDDGLTITPAPLHGGLWSTYHDHRMATAGAIIGLRVPDVLIENIATTSKTLPEFPQLWLAMTGN